jgi:DNA-binding LacI/PurR family transcriptional regulator
LGYALLLKELPSFHTIEITPILNFLVSRHVDGIIWAVSEIGANREHLQQQLDDLSIPVSFLTMSAREGMFIVAVDNYRGGRMAAEHLLEQGCRDIGHIAGPLEWWESRQRKAGWQDALLQAGIPVEAHYWEAGDWSSASGQQAMIRLSDRYPKMDALFVANDQMALGALQYACKMGIKVPDQLAMVGFDNIPESEYFWPPLTTVHQDTRLLGKTAVRELVRTIEAIRLGEDAIQPQVIILCPELVVRESSIKKSSV